MRKAELAQPKTDENLVRTQAPAQAGAAAAPATRCGRSRRTRPWIVFRSENSRSPSRSTCKRRRA